MIEAAFIITGALFFGWLSRMAGGAPPKLPWGLDQHIIAFIYALPFLPLAWASIRGKEKFKPLFPPILAYFASFTGKRTGHGRFLAYKAPMKEGSEPEKTEYAILWLIDKIPMYWYKFLGMTITGLIVTLPAGILLTFAHPILGPLIALSGALKGVSYAIGWEIYPEGTGKGILQLNEATQIGEFLTGFFAGLPLFATLYEIYFN